MLKITVRVTEWATASIECYPDKILTNGIPIDADFLYSTLKLAASQAEVSDDSMHKKRCATPSKQTPVVRQWSKCAFKK